MKYILAFLTVASLSSFSFQNSVDPELVFVEFTNRTTFKNLVDIQSEMAEKGITLEYMLIEFDEENTYVVDEVEYYQLKNLSIKVDCNDGFSGTGNAFLIPDKSRLAFMRDYRENAKIPFGVYVNE